MHRVLSIPEILLYIFSCLSTADNASNVRVCKLWSHLALDIVWYSVEDVAGVFQSLTEMYVNEEGELEFLRTPTERDWNSFLNNAQRIRDLDFYTTKRKLAATSLREIATTRPSRKPIFPNIQTVRAMFEDPAFDPTFLGSSVQTLFLAIVKIEVIHDKTAKVIKQFPRLDRLSIASRCDADLLEGHLCELMAGLPSLTDVRVPINCLTPSLLETASRMPKLRVLQGDHRRREWHEMNSDGLPSFQPVAFPSLNAVTMTWTLPDAARFLQTPNFPSHSMDELRLYVVLQKDEKLAHNKSIRVINNDLKHFSGTVAYRCPSLHALSIIMWPIDWNKWSIPESLALNFYSLTPLLQLTHLTILSIVNPISLDMTDDQVQELAMALPNLQNLGLATRATVQHPSDASGSLTLRSLNHLAVYCPSMLFLGLWLDASRVVPAPNEAIRFPRLVSLHLGYSLISKSIDPVVDFIFRSLPRGAEFAVCDDRVHDSRITRVPADSITNQDRSWRRVQEALGWMAKGRDTNRDLENKVARLERTLAGAEEMVSRLQLHNRTG